MAKWSLVCPRCNHKFTHIKINEAVVAEAYRDSYGTDAKPAVPALIDLLNDKGKGVRNSADLALKMIDPEAAVKAGLK